MRLHLECARGLHPGRSDHSYQEHVFSFFIGAIDVACAYLLVRLGRCVNIKNPCVCLNAYVFVRVNAVKRNPPHGNVQIWLRGTSSFRRSKLKGEVLQLRRPIQGPRVQS